MVWLFEAASGIDWTFSSVFSGPLKRRARCTSTMPAWRPVTHHPRGGWQPRPRWRASGALNEISQEGT